MSDQQTASCPACGAVTRGSKFCPECGVPLAAATGRLQTGQILAGRYHIQHTLARGGMSAVYLAHDSRLGDAPVAIKEMALGHMGSDERAKEEALELFRREATLLARLSHTLLPRVFDQFEEHGRQFLVMEYVRGQTLRHAVNEHQPTLETVLTWADQLCDVLSYLHRQQPPIIYRDLKPSNVMLREDGRLALIDFGIARLYKPEKSGDTITFGTLGYAPPEQYGHGQTDGRTDMYALGVMIHHFLTGYDPSSTPFQRPPLHILRADLPRGLSDVVARATAHDPAQRFATMDEFRTALKQSLQQHYEPTAVAGLPPQPAYVHPGLHQGNAQRSNAGAPVPLQRPAARRRSTLPLLLILGALLLAGGAAALGLGAFSNQEEVAGTSVAANPSDTADPATPDEPTTDDSVITAATVTPLPVILGPAAARASAVAEPAPDACGTVNDYEPDKAIDSRYDTAWRVDGAAEGEALEIFMPGMMQIAKIGMIAGYDKIDPCDGTDRFFQGRIITRVRIDFDNGQSVEADLLPVREMQYIEIPNIPAVSFTIVVLETTAPPVRDGRDITSISEIEVHGVMGR